MKNNKKEEHIIILGVNADIGKNICKSYLEDGFKVIGTYRRYSENMKELLNLKGLTLFQYDITNKQDIRQFENFIHENNIFWTTVFSSIGTSEPIGRFFDLSFDEWERSIQINCIGQLRALHALYKYRIRNKISNVIFLAGGGTNNPFRCYSAYCISKIMLIKMCELLDDEYPDINIFIVGPGFVRTKTHLETLKAGKKAEKNFDRVKKFWESGEIGTPIENIYACMRWLESKGRRIAGGRNFSVAHDRWGNSELAEELIKDKNMYKLRRYRNDWQPDQVEDINGK